MPSDGALVVRALGYWAGWLVIARKFGWPPPDSEGKKAPKGGPVKGKQLDKGTKADAPIASKDQPKAAAPAKPKPDGNKKCDSKANAVAGASVDVKNTTKSTTTAPPVALPTVIEAGTPKADVSATTKSTSIWNLFGSFGKDKPTSKDCPREAGLQKTSNGKATAGNTDNAVSSK